MINICLLTVIMLFSIGCGEPTLDTTSAETLDQSTEAMFQTLPKAKQDEFIDAMCAIATSHMADILKVRDSEEKEHALITKIFHGKTASQIIADGAVADEKIKKATPQQALFMGRMQNQLKQKMIKELGVGVKP